MSEQPIIAHLNELRHRALICIGSVLLASIFAYINYAPIAAWISAPFNLQLPSDAKIMVGTIYEGFYVKIKLAILAGLVLSLPIIVFQMCRYIIPGLSAKETKWALIALFTSSLLASLSVIIGYGVVFPCFSLRYQYVS